MSDIVIGSGVVLLVGFEEYHRDVLSVVAEMGVDEVV